MESKTRKDLYYEQYKGFYIEIRNITADNDLLVFKPYIIDYNDNYKSDWNQEYVMGRMDAIATFRRTTRTIQLSFSVPSNDYLEASNNWKNAKTLRDFLYPTYKVIKSKNKNVDPTSLKEPEGLNGNLKRYYRAQRQVNILEAQLDVRRNVALMSGNPILSLKFADLICDSKGKPLYGYMDGISLKPNQESGHYVVGSEKLVPKSFDLSFTFTVVHTEPLGYDQQGKLRKLEE